MTGKDALRELVENGWFARRADGVCYAVRPPSKKHLGHYVALVAKLGQYAVPLSGGRAPIEVTSGSPETGPMFKSVG